MQVEETSGIVETAEAAKRARELIGVGAVAGMPSPAQRFWGGSVVTLCSVYPLGLVATMNWAGITTYHLKPSPPEGCSLLRVGDSYQNIQNLINPEDYPVIPAPITAMQAAVSLKEHWVGNAIGAESGYTIGLDLVPGDEPTEEFVTNLRERQRRYFLYLIQKADAHFARQEFKMIGEPHFAAARWMGLDNRQWYTIPHQQQLSECVACNKRIPFGQLVCDHCGTNIPIFYYQMGMEPDPDKDPRIHQFWLTYKDKVESGQEVPPLAAKTEIRKTVGGRKKRS